MLKPMVTLALCIPRKLILQLQARLNVHARQFLNEKLGSIWHRHLYHAPAALATLTPIVVAHHATILANLHLMRIGAEHQTLKKQLTGAVRDQTITLPLSETQTTQ